jgi:hypothetical protein
MARPRKTDPRPVMRPLLAQFARDLAAAVEKFTYERTLARLGGKPGRGAPKLARRGGKRAQVRCYYPGCKNVAAPRFGMFCAALHKGLSKTEKEKHRAQRRAARR